LAAGRGVGRTGKFLSKKTGKKQEYASIYDTASVEEARQNGPILIGPALACNYCVNLDTPKSL